MDWVDAFSSGNEQTAENAARELIRGGRVSLDICRELHNHPAAEVRWWVVRALAEMLFPESGFLLVERVSDADIEVQQCAALALRHNPCAAAVPALLALLNHHNALLARLAADALIAVGKPAVPGLIETLRQSSLPARQQAVRCLARIADPEAVSALFEALDDDSAWISHFADEGLERMGVGMTFFRP